MRIVGGVARGRRLAGPADGTRPTSDRAREAMFNTLAATIRLDGARVLDLYSGTGAVGLEALSRGARDAVLVEKGRAALAVLRRNVDTVALPGAQVVPLSVGAYLRTPPAEPFDLVFADPPYSLADERISAIIASLRAAPWLAPDAVLVIERSARAAPSGWAGDSLTPFTAKRYGDSVLWYGRAT